MYTYIYIYIYIEREREREGEHLFHDGGRTTSTIKLGRHTSTAGTQCAQSKRPRLKTGSPHSTYEEEEDTCHMRRRRIHVI
jgi:hypothetical protein